MPVIEYYAEAVCSHEMQFGGSTWLWLRSKQLVEADETAPNAEPGSGLDDVFCLREYQDGELVFSVDVELEPFLMEGSTYTETTSIGEQNISYSALESKAINWPEESDTYRGPVTSLIADGTCVFAPYPEGQLIAVSVEEGSKGIERWRVDGRNPRYNDTTTAWELLCVDTDGYIVAAFRERRVHDVESREIAWNAEWGEDDDYSVTDVRSPNNAGEYGAYPAGIAWINPRTGTEIARWYGEVRFLSAPSIPRGFIYDSHSWSPGDDPQIPYALVKRPYDSEIVGFEPDGEGGYIYEWSNDGHLKWSIASVRFSGAGGTVECSGIGAGLDFINPYAWVNGIGPSEWETVTGSGSYYYAYDTQTVTWRYIGELDEEEEADLRGSDPPHSLTSVCLTPDNYVVFGPRFTGNYAFVDSEEVEIYDPKRFVWRAVRRAGAFSTVVWETSLGQLPGEDVDTLRNRQSTTPLCAGGKILTVIQDYIQTVPLTVHGAVRFVELDAATGEVLSDDVLDPALWGGEEGDKVVIYPEAQIYQGRFLCRLNGYEILI